MRRRRRTQSTGSSRHWRGSAPWCDTSRLRSPADPSGAHPVSGARVVCTVSVVTGPGHRAEVRAKGRHPYEAIDRAAGRIRKILVLRTSASAETQFDDETALDRESA